MIADEQLKLACNAYDQYNVDHNNTLLRGVCSGHAMRKALESYEQSKWVKFEPNNESTYPPEPSIDCPSTRTFSVLVKLKNNMRFIIKDYFDWDTNEFTQYGRNVTHWQPLPEFKG